MAKNNKARKHALRKMITTAVLAGTAITTIGGAMGSVTTVKAEEKKTFRIDLEDRMNLNKIISDKKFSLFTDETDEQIVEKLRQFLKTAKMETILKLSEVFTASGKGYYTDSKIFNTKIGSLSDSNGETITFNDLILEALQKRMNELEEKKDLLAEKDKQLLSEAKKVTEKTQLLKKQTDELESIKSDLAEEKLREEELLKEKSQLEGSLSVTAKIAADKNKEISKLRKLLTELNTRSADLLTKEGNKNRALKRELEQEKEAFKDEINKTKVLVEEANVKAEEINNRLKEAEAEKVSQTAKLNEKIAGLEEESEIFKDTMEALESQKFELAKSVSSLKEQLASTEQEKAQLKEKLDIESSALKAAEEKLAGLQNSAPEVDEDDAEDSKDLEEKIVSLEKELAQAQGESKELKSKLADLESELEDVKSEKAKLEESIDTLNKEHAEETVKLKESLSDKEKINEELKKTIEALKNDLENKSHLSKNEKPQLNEVLDNISSEMTAPLSVPEVKNEADSNQFKAKMTAAQENNGKEKNKPTPPAQVNQNQEKNHLPSTGEEEQNPFFSAAAIAIMVGAGTLAYKRKGKETE